MGVERVKLPVASGKIAPSGMPEGRFRNARRPCLAFLRGVSDDESGGSFELECGRHIEAIAVH